MTTPSIGRMVRWARKRAGLTQQDLAHAIRVPQPTIARIESGSVLPRTATLVAILDATGHGLTVEPSGPKVDRDAIRGQLALEVPQRTWRALGRAAAKSQTGPTRILRRLRAHGVPFVLFGELAEVARGAPAKLGPVIEVCRADTDDVHDRLTAALQDLGATPLEGYWFMTKAGRIHLVTETAAGDDYRILVRNADWMYVDSGLRVRVAALDDLIRIRHAGTTPADRAAEAVLRAIGDE
jgi:transcriptional regulator with XRE-family HTH domain